MLDWRQVKKSQAKGYTTDTFIRSTYVKPLRIIMKVLCKYVSIHIFYIQKYSLLPSVPSSYLHPYYVRRKKVDYDIDSLMIVKNK